MNLPMALASLAFDSRLLRAPHGRHSHEGMIDMAKIAYAWLKLAELHVLATLLRERSISRTADLLGTTQPAISKVLGHLREQFADPLFVRNGHAMQPTTRALDLSQRLSTLLAAADDLRAAAAAFDPARSDRQFNLLLTD